MSENDTVQIVPLTPEHAQGTAGDYQVDGARRVATLNIGGTATTNVCFVVDLDS